MTKRDRWIVLLLIIIYLFLLEVAVEATFSLITSLINGGP